MAYCSIEAARDAGCTGTDAEVAAWIQAAREGIERLYHWLAKHERSLPAMLV